MPPFLGVLPQVRPSGVTRGDLPKPPPLSLAFYSPSSGRLPAPCVISGSGTHQVPAGIGMWGQSIALVVARGSFGKVRDKTSLGMVYQSCTRKCFWHLKSKGVILNYSFGEKDRSWTFLIEYEGKRTLQCNWLFMSLCITDNGLLPLMYTHIIIIHITIQKCIHHCH